MTTLATGTSLDQKWANRLGTIGNAIPPATQTSMIVIGPSNQGKSCFVQSIPDNFIINTDASSTTNPSPKAHLWPFIGSEDGNLYDTPGGKPVTLTWDLVLAKVDELCEMAKDQWAGRPKVVTLDTVDTALALAIDYVTRHAKQLGLVAEGRETPTEFNQLNGLAAWPLVYGQFQRVRNTLRSHGYGVIFCMHLIPEKVVHLTESEAAIQKNIPRVTDGFWGRLYPEFEVIPCVRKKTIPVTTEVPQFGPGKKPIMDPATGKQKVKKNTKNEEKYVLDFGVPICKKRRRMFADQLILSPTEGWSDYEREYKASIEKETASD